MKLPLLYKDHRDEGTTPTRQAQLVELHLLEVFKRICDDHGLRFWLVGGTLLGALRHGGPIPWDDDLDVMILESDYKKFLKFAKDELPDDVYLEVPSDNLRMENHITRLRDNYSWGLVRRSKRLLINDHHGICIDIFPVREAGNNSALAKWLCRRLSSVYGYYKRAHYDKVSFWNLVRKWGIGLKVLFLKLCFEGTQFFARKKFYVMASWFVNDRMWWPKEWLVQGNRASRTVEYDGHLMPIPFNAEDVLEMEYGDWRTMPPHDKRVGYLTVCLPTTPCFHPAAMQYPKP